MGQFSETNLFGMTIRESATDGSDFTNPDADYRRLFLGEDGQLHVKDSAGTVTDIGAGTGAPDDASYVTYEAEAGLSGEIVRPELGETSSGSDIDFTAPTTGTNVTASVVAGMTKLTALDTAYRWAYVASAIATGDFDVRMRVVSACPIDISAGVSSPPLFAFGLSDSSSTDSTALLVVLSPPNGSGAIPNVTGRVHETVQGDTLSGWSFPLVLRMTRSGTTVTYYVSQDEGHIWIKLGTATSALNIARIGARLHDNAGGDVQALVHWIRG
jgi:hypothetical protein